MRKLGEQNEAVVSATALMKIYRRGREQVRALDGLSLEVNQGEFVAVTGPSGAGKSTLLNMLGCMDVPSSGKLELLGKPVEKFSERERTRFRGEQIGFVFQHFGLLPALTVAENVTLPAFFASRNPKRQIDALMEKVGLIHRRNHRPHELSGGEMQRTAIARALINDPGLLLADEPTGNLDEATGDSIITLFKELNRDGLTLIVVTHNPRLSQAAGRRLELRDGRITNWTATNGWAEAAMRISGDGEPISLRNQRTDKERKIC